MSRAILIIFIISLSVLCLMVSGYAVRDRIEKDSAGREWALQNWEAGARAYPKDLKEREQQYREKWGESWNGQQVAQRIYSPGNWKWEVYHEVPADIAARLEKTADKRYPWGSRYNIMTFVWAPTGEQITDLYVATNSSFYHYDANSKKGILIGNPEKYGDSDGLMDKALINLLENNAALDRVTGRLYFAQKIGNKKNLRFVEKLLPYQCSKTKSLFYLPAVLDINHLYKKVQSPAGGNLEPIERNGKAGETVFVVRTNYALEILHLPGSHRGKRLLITPDGKGLYYALERKTGKAWWLGTLYDITSLFDIETGKLLSKINLSERIPENYKGGDAPGTHGGNNLGFDGNIYTSQHGGAGGGPGRMFSINPESGEITMLYDSLSEDGSWRKGRSSVFDGPADANSLWFTSTLWQTQCPRTGAIINGGWDNSGIRRYHDGFVTTIAGHYYGGFNQPARPGWSTGFVNVYHNSNPAVAPNGDLYIADVNSEWRGKTLFAGARIIQIYRTDWPKEQPVNGYAKKYISDETLESLRIEYAKKYIANFDKNNKLLKEAGY